MPSAVPVGTGTDVPCRHTRQWLSPNHASAGNKPPKSVYTRNLIHPNVLLSSALLRLSVPGLRPYRTGKSHTRLERNPDKYPDNAYKVQTQHHTLPSASGELPPEKSNYTSCAVRMTRYPFPHLPSFALPNAAFQWYHRQTAGKPSR